MTSEEVLASKKYLSQIGQWPKFPLPTNPQRWLEGFDECDQEHASALLDSFVYFSQEQTTKLVTATFHSISAELAPASASYVEKRTAWHHFLDDCLLSFPTGEDPNPTDSGHAFVRIARKELGIEQDRVMVPGDAVSRLYQGESAPIVIIDDFAGSGDQFLATWRRPYEMPSGEFLSLSDVVEKSDAAVFYVAAVATKYAAEKLQIHAPKVKLRAAHVLSEHYSAQHPESVLFPDHLRADAVDFVERASRTASIAKEWIWGWHSLGLAIAFEHSVPDATLPIVWVDTPTWSPLMRRS